MKISLLTFQLMHGTHSGQWKEISIFLIYKKPVNHKNSQKVFFGSQKGPLHIIIWHCTPIIGLSCCKHMIYVSAQNWIITQMITVQRLTKKLKCSYSAAQRLTLLCQFMVQNSKYPLHENLSNFSTFQKMSKKLALNDPGTSQSVTYSKIKKWTWRIP